MSDAIVLAWVGLIFFAAVFCTCISIFQLFQNKKIGFDKGFLFSLSASLVSVLLCLSIWPPLHRVYGDEFSYISQSSNILLLGKAITVIKGSRLQPEAFMSWISFTKMPGFAWLEAVILFLTKDFNYSYFILNIILGALSVMAVYRIAWLWTENLSVAWWSAIFMACLPVHITYSMSAASDIAGSFFFLLFLLFISEYRVLQSRFILYAALFSGVYCICIRLFDSIFVILGLTAALHIYRRDGLLDKKSCSQLLLDTVCLLLPVLTAVPLMYMYYSNSITFSLSFLLKNILTSTIYMFNYHQMTLLTTLAALLAVGRSIFYKRDNLVIGLAGWFLMGFLLISAFYAGGIAYPGDAYSDRYILSFIFPLVLLAGKGMDELITKLWPPLLAALFSMVLVVNAFFASNYLNDEAKDGFHQQKTLLLKQVLRLVPNEAYIVDACTALVTAVSSKKSIQTQFFTSGNHPEKVVFLKGTDDDLYNSDDPKNTFLAEEILNTGYRCRSMSAVPFKAEYLSATPFLCTRTH